MKSPGIIYRNYRRIKRKILYEMLVESRLVLHKNCFYGCTLYPRDLNGVETSILICQYKNNGDDPLDICTCPRDCNAFVNKWSKDTIIENYNKIMDNDDLKRRFHPDLYAYEWVLDKDLDDAKKSPKMVNKVIVYIISFLEHLLRKRS